MLLSVTPSYGALFLQAAAQHVNGSFSVLSYNIAGLPGIISSGNPKVNTPLISPRLSPYDIVNVQEDFAYHQPLYAQDNHPYRTTTSGNVPFGSGLNTLSNYPISDVQRVTWNRCWINYGDCLTRKGFSLARVALAQNVSIDVYNLHTGAGDTCLDAAARKSNIAQVISYIGIHSVGNAVLVYGDTNALYTHSTDGIRQFVDAGFTDVWLQLIRKGNGTPAPGSPSLYCEPGDGKPVNNECETLDKIFYRSSSKIVINATDYQNENTLFLDPTGKPLSDHYPIAAEFTYLI